MKKFYITTPIYYVNGTPTIGTATTTIAADTLSRYYKLRGKDSYFLTGTDENATKVVEAAQAVGTGFHEFVDRLANEYKETWKFLDIKYDDFIRTTETRHARVVQEFFRRLIENGCVYKDTYEGWYSVSDETFLRDSEVENGLSIESGKPVKRVSEENYFFRLSAFGDKLLTHYKANPDFWQPKFRANEVIKFVEEGLRDVCITRKNNGWGIEMPSDPQFVIYVWFDALINYLSATGWPDDENKFRSLWPADLHLMAKEIFVRFHATLWPAMLMALELLLPKVIFAHGWLTVGGEKGSKSSGNLPHPVQFCKELSEKSGCSVEIAANALRYILLREMRFGEDSEYSIELYHRRFNSDLANDLGNVLNRTLAMMEKYHSGVVQHTEIDTKISELITKVTEECCSQMESLRFDLALESVWSLVAKLNKFIDESAPWALVKAGDVKAASNVLYSTLEGIRIISLLVFPFMPKVSIEINRQLGIEEQKDYFNWDSVETVGLFQVGHKVQLPLPIFPRIDMNKEVSRIVSEMPIANDEQVPSKQEIDNLITIDDFKKIELKIARIIEAEAHPNADKLLKLKIDVGEAEPRPLVAGIAGSYEPQDLVGKLIVIVANLKPATIRGEVSQGMLLAAELDGKAIILSPESADVTPGTNVR